MRDIYSLSEKTSAYEADTATLKRDQPTHQRGERRHFPFLGIAYVPVLFARISDVDIMATESLQHSWDLGRAGQSNAQAQRRKQHTQGYRVSRPAYEQAT